MSYRYPPEFRRKDLGEPGWHGCGLSSVGISGGDFFGEGLDRRLEGVSFLGVDCLGQAGATWRMRGIRRTRERKATSELRPLISRPPRSECRSRPDPLRGSPRRWWEHQADRIRKPGRFSVVAANGEGLVTTRTPQEWTPLSSSPAGPVAISIAATTPPCSVCRDRTKSAASRVATLYSNRLPPPAAAKGFALPVIAQVWHRMPDTPPSG